MDRRVKERLVGASILVVLIVLIAPELLSGPAPPPAAALLPALTPPPTRNVTVDLRTSKAPAPESVDTVSVPAAQPPGTREAASAVPAAAAEPPPAAAGSVPAAAATAAPATAAAASLETSLTSPTSASTAAKPTDQGRGTWAVQLGSFASHDNADKLVRQLKAQGFTVYVLPGGSGASLRYRVRIGPMMDRNAALLAVAKLTSLGHAATSVPPGA
jgi:DedD protein